MKQTLLTRLVLGAIAGIAATGAYAGQIQASSVSIAREVIVTDAQAVTAPSIAYRFAGDVDARVQAQTFQVQFTLATGTWAVAPAANTVSVTDGVSAVIQDQSPNAPVGPATASYTVTAINKSADNKTVWATIVVNQGAAALIKQPIISLNVSANTIAGVAAVNVSASRGTLNGLKTVVGDLVTDYTSAGKCVDTKTMAVNFKHYVALTNPTAIATDANATPDEHTRAGATNVATLIAFPTNILVGVNRSTGGAILTPGGNLTFTANGAGNSFVSATTVLLGNVSLTQNAVGYDTNLTNQYVLAGVASGANATGLDAIATAANNVGDVEVSSVTVQVAATQGFSVGSNLTVNTLANCNGVTVATQAIAAGSEAGPITITIPTANVNAAFGAAGTGPAYVCYNVTGAATIPSSSFSAVATVVKAAAGGTLYEQNNVCSGNLYALGGGVKIDVRNYASSKETSGYQSVIRFINSSDVAAADVWGQIIHQDGKLGGWGKLGDIPARGSMNMTATQIEAKLTNAATAAVGATAAAAQAATATTSDTAPRLRITSTTGRALRVQNYLFNRATGQILEASGQQGVDFEGTALRAPSSEGQYQDQDAQSGLNLAP